MEVYVRLILKLKIDWTTTVNNTTHLLESTLLRCSSWQPVSEVFISILLNANVLIQYHLAVILLSFVLAVGFLMIILSCALWHNWLPLIVGMPLYHLYTYLLRCSIQNYSPNVCTRTSSQRTVRALRFRRIRRGLGPGGPGSLLHLSHRCVWLRFAYYPRPLGSYRPEGLYHVDYRGRVRHISPQTPKLLNPNYRLVYGTILAYSAAFSQEDPEYE